MGYVINEDEYTDKEAYRTLYIYSIDVDTGLNKEVYKKKRFFLGNDASEIFATDVSVNSSTPPNKYTSTIK